ncbi:hypothetical protein [Roseovarius sp. TE539]|uniref:hypothetical protein n=1 Tax=Roseovarius sp. TE539 TaxID=2249812 RepID=UPI0011BDBB2A|nr:hypothetical protein [Roseovarius sp. TE539]
MVGARVPHDPDVSGDQTHAREQVVRLLARELYNDLTEELINLLEWVIENNVGRDVEKKINRLISLTQGEDVPSAWRCCATPA